MSSACRDENGILTDTGTLLAGPGSVASTALSGPPDALTAHTDASYGGGGDESDESVNDSDVSVSKQDDEEAAGDDVIGGVVTHFEYSLFA